jgi:hypothetical protein
VSEVLVPQAPRREMTKMAAKVRMMTAKNMMVAEGL